MFERLRKQSTVKDGIRNENWKHCRELIESDKKVGCLGYIMGENQYGDFVALVGDDGTNYYIPSWYKAHLEGCTDEEKEFMMSGQTITVTKREYVPKGKTKPAHTYGIKIGAEEI